MKEINQNFRLNEVAYQALEKAVMAEVLVSSQTTDIQAGYQLGIQKVLKALRDGFVVVTPR